MQRFLIPTVLLLFGIGYVASSHYFGLRTERALVGNARALSEIGIETDFEDYRRGIFRSRFRLHLDYEDLLGNWTGGNELSAIGLPTSLDIPVTLHHGPLVFSETGVFGLAALSADLTDLFAESLGDSGTPADLRLSLRLRDEGFDGRISLGALDIQVQETGYRLKSEPVRLDFGAEDQFRAFPIRLESGPIQVDFGVSQLSVGPGILESEAYRVNRFLRFGSQRAKIDSTRIEVSGMSGMRFGSGALRYETVSGEEPENQDAFFSRTDYVVENIEIAMPNRPAFTGDLIVNMALRDVSRQGYDALMISIADYGDEPGSPAYADGMAPTLESMRAPLNTLFATSPTLDMTRLAFVGADGSLEARLRLAAAAGDEIDEGETLPTVLAGLLTGEGLIEIDKNLLRAVLRTFLAPDPENEANVESMLETMLQPTIDSGMFRAEGDKLLSVLVLADGVFNMNSRTIFDANAFLAAQEKTDPEPE